MSTKLKAGTATSGAVIDADTTGILELQTGSTPTTAVTVDTSQNVGIGTATIPADAKVAISGTGLVLQDASGAIQRFNKTLGTDTAWISNRSYSWHNGNGLALSTQTADDLKFGTNSAERMRIDSSGNLNIGTTGVANRLVTQGSTTNNTASAFQALNSAGTILCTIRNDGVFYTGVAAASPYNNTTASAANLYVGSGGDLYRSTSSLKYKTDVQDAIHGLDEVLKLRSVTYKGKADGDTVFGGLIAEEVDAVGLTEFVQYAEDGTPDALAYGQMVSLLAKAIQELNAKVDAQTAEIQALKGVA